MPLILTRPKAVNYDVVLDADTLQWCSDFLANAAKLQRCYDKKYPKSKSRKRKSK
jgi:hypothetical protein